jgi:23S rRNA pseudouridine1911/1915/1917 synthase
MSERLPKFTKKDCIDLLWAFGQLPAEIVDDLLLTDIHVSTPEPDVMELAFTWVKTAYRAYWGADYTPTGRLADLGERPFKNHLMHLYQVLPDKKRLDQLLVERFPDLNRSELQRRVSAGLVQVDGAIVTKPSAQTPVEASIALLDSAAPPTLDLPVLYEDDDVIVINKPTGVLSHAKGELSTEPTVATWLADRLATSADIVPNASEKLSGDGEHPPTNRAGIVHRLDRGTSGVMILAKTPAAEKFLQKQFAERQTAKTYYAVTLGTPRQAEAIIDLPIARNLKKPTTFVVSAHGRAAVTELQVLKSHGHYALLELKPQTGRTHQLRVHLSYLNHPIIGDLTYGGPEAKRVMLHAGALTVRLPSGITRTFTAPLPEEFSKYVG